MASMGKRWLCSFTPFVLKLPSFVSGGISHAILWGSCHPWRLFNRQCESHYLELRTTTTGLRFTSLNGQERSITNGPLLKNSTNKAGGHKTAVANFVEQTRVSYLAALALLRQRQHADRCPAGDRNRIDLHRSITRRTTCAATDIRDAPRIHFPRLNHPEFVT